MRLNFFSDHTYTHETLFNALDRNLRVVSLPLAARHVARPWRLITSLPKHIWRAGLGVLQSILRYRPLQAYGSLGTVLALLGSVPFARFLYFFANGEPGGHLQSLIAGSVLLFFAAQMFVIGLLAAAISWNRQLLEEVLFRMKDSVSRPGAEGRTEQYQESVKERQRAA